MCILCSLILERNKKWLRECMGCSIRRRQRSCVCSFGINWVFHVLILAGGWLIFDVPEADLTCHESTEVFHSISFYCDDIHKTVEDLKSRGLNLLQASLISIGIAYPLSNAWRYRGWTLWTEVQKARAKQNTTSQDDAEKKKNEKVINRARLAKK